MATYWNVFAENYRNIAPPLKPCAEDVRIIEDTLARWWSSRKLTNLKALLCGVTPALAELSLPAEAHLTAVEHSQPMIDGIWPGDTAKRSARCGNWLDLPFADNSYHIVLGDGCINCLPYPAGYRALFASLHRVMHRDGVFLMRLFVRPNKSESSESVFADLLSAKIPSFHIFKWRLAMALQNSTSEGIVVHRIYQAWADRNIKVSELVNQFGWSENGINAINGYREKETRFTFPTVDEIQAMFSETFDEMFVREPAYPLGERCPIFALTPRLKK